ncbi:MAG: glycosyltransferase [Bryobacteraceae bacterium]|jgi:glycosyltransferase involved in cell wall biosynthesis
MKQALHIIRGLDPRSGGTSASVPALVRAVAATGRYYQRIVYFSDSGDYEVVIPEVEVIRISWSPAAALFGKLWRSLSRLISQCDLAHIHGIWEGHCVTTGQICRKLDRPFIVSAHGMLERWALLNKRWKKSPYSALVERPNLRGAACLRALTMREIADYRRYGLHAPAALIPNGIDPPPSFSPDPFYLAFPGLAGKRLVLFLSRIHYKKGVDILCRAWAAVAKEFPGAHLVIAGPDYEGTLSRIEALVRKLRLETSVTYTGMLAGKEKWAALAAAEFFVLPSHSEGFSIAILEALAMARPVIITPGCNFPEVAQMGCGAVVGPSDREIEGALRDMLSRRPEERAAMGARGVELVQSCFSWPAIGEQMTAVNDWVLGCGPMPERVFPDSAGSKVETQCIAS